MYSARHSDRRTDAAVRRHGPQWCAVKPLRANSAHAVPAGGCPPAW